MTNEPCACGRTHPRIMRILGRTDDMLILRVDGIAKAREVLGEKNVKIATKEEIQTI